MTMKYGTRAVQAFTASAIVVCLTVLLPLPVAAQEVADADIISAIDTQMRIDNAVTANNVDVSSINGVVTLTGTVDNILEKERAQALAEATVGVRTIVNRIDVEPVTPRTDNELKTAVESAWLVDPVAKSYRLEAEVDDGIVTISGTVSSHAERDLSATVAKGVRGVKDIVNETVVDYGVTRTDQQIQNEISGRLENDVRIDDALIQVSVSNGNVTLSGSVGSLQEKTRARSNAWVAGVVSVDADDLDLRWWARDEMRRTRAHITRTDDEIQEAVEDALVYDPRVMSDNVDAAVTGGTVILSGTVNNLAAKRAAEQDARNTIGVIRVTNNIKVRPDIPADDVLETRVASALRVDPYIERYNVTVNAHGGWVYLSGNVDTSFKKNRAERVTEGVEGVVGVVNNLDYDYQWVWARDQEIRDNVRDQLRWNPFVEADNVRLSVDDGVVTLHGTVNAWSEREEAEKNAFQGGAKDVINNLVVDHRHYGPYSPGYYGSPTYRGPGYYGPAYEPYQ